MLLAHQSPSAQVGRGISEPPAGSAVASSEGLTPAIRLNELMVNNQSWIADEMGEFDNWIELHNSGLLPLDVGGMALGVTSLWPSDDPASPTLWLIPDDTVIPGHSFLLIWADGEPAEGPFHTSFLLMPRQTLNLFDKQIFGGIVVDHTIVNPTAPDWSWARQSDDLSAWTLFERPSPGALNADHWLFFPRVAYPDDYPDKNVVINEFMAANNSTLADEAGEYDDWIELFNPGLNDVDVGGMYLSDDLGDLALWRIPSGTVISQSGHLLLWADDQEDQGPLHTSFKLSQDGENLLLVAADGFQVRDWITYSAQREDFSFGRMPDGADSWQPLFEPTPGSPNLSNPIYIMGTMHRPATPNVSDTVTVTSQVIATYPPLTVTLFYHVRDASSAAREQFTQTAMSHTGDGVYSAQIPALPSQTLVQYYIQVRDALSQTATDPAGAPQDTFRYAVDLPLGTLVINELMAANDSVIRDNNGDYDDWIELYNSGSTELDLGGFFLTDDLQEPTLWQIPSGTTMPPGGFKLIWADSEPHEGPNHANFRLNASGEAVGLFGPDGMTAIDSITYTAQSADVSLGRYPDGTGDWLSMPTPTPGYTNTIAAPPFLRNTDLALTRAPGTASLSNDSATVSIRSDHSANAEAAEYHQGLLTQPSSFRSAVSQNLSHIAFIPLMRQDPPPYEMRINVGGPVYTTTQGVVYQADRPYTPENGAGYVYTGTVLEWHNAAAHPMGGTKDKWLYADVRMDFGEYRFDVPNNDYLVTLQLAAIFQHASGQHVFDVAIESSPVLTDFDIYAEANLWYAMDIPVPVVVTDGQLNVVFSPTVGYSLLNAIAVTSEENEPMTPTLPRDVQTVGCYDRNLLDWEANSEPDLLGYQVRRTTLVSELLQVITSPVRFVPYYLDDDVGLGQVYSYSVRAINAAGQASNASAEITATTLPLTQTALPVYELTIAPEYQALLDANPWTDEYVPAIFRHEGIEYDVGVRYRGAWTSRNTPKKSWKIRFSESQLFQGRRFLNLISGFSDRRFITEKLAYDLFHTFGVDGSEARLIHFRLNGQFWGVYTDVEHVDEYFLLRSGRPVGSSIYDVVAYGDFTLKEDPHEYELIYEKRTNQSSGYHELISLLELVNNTPDAQFPEAIVQVFQVASYLHYYATVILSSNGDVMTWYHNSFLIHNPETGRWEVVPWDNGAAFGNVRLPIDHGTPGHRLLTRLLDVPEFRLFYGRHLIEAMDGEFSPSRVGRMVDVYRDLIGPDGLCDIWHRTWWTRDFNPYVTDFVQQRGAYLQSVVYSYTAGLTLPLTLELSPSGDQLFLHNRGLLDWDIGGMEVRDDRIGGDHWIMPTERVVPAGGTVVLWDAHATTVGSTRNALTAEEFSNVNRIELLDKPAHNAQLVAKWTRDHSRPKLPSRQLLKSQPKHKH